MVCAGLLWRRNPKGTDVSIGQPTSEISHARHDSRWHACFFNPNKGKALTQPYLGHHLGHGLHLWSSRAACERGKSLTLNFSFSEILKTAVTCLRDIWNKVRSSQSVFFSRYLNLTDLTDIKCYSKVLSQFKYYRWWWWLMVTNIC